MAINGLHNWVDSKNDQQPTNRSRALQKLPQPLIYRTSTEENHDCQKGISHDACDLIPISGGTNINEYFKLRVSIKFNILNINDGKRRNFFGTYSCVSLFILQALHRFHRLLTLHR
jgi:hypothetical protein